MRYTNFTTIFLIAVCLMLLTGFCTNLVKADENIEFKGEPTYYCYKIKDNQYYYYINLTLCNIGDGASVPINVGIKWLMDTEYKYIYPLDCSEQVLNAGECESFTIDWPTIYTHEEVEIVYSATEIKDQNEGNSGSKSITLVYSEASNEKTPGFEFFMILIAISLLFVLKNRKKRF